MTDLETIAFLFDLLDDIDSQDDVCKENDAAYRKRVRQLQRKRFETGITTDGYTAAMPDGRALPEREVYRL